MCPGLFKHRYGGVAAKKNHTRHQHLQGQLSHIQPYRRFSHIQLYQHFTNQHGVFLNNCNDKTPKL